MVAGKVNTKGPRTKKSPWDISNSILSEFKMPAVFLGWGACLIVDRHAKCRLPHQLVVHGCQDCRLVGSASPVTSIWPHAWLSPGVGAHSHRPAPPPQTHSLRCCSTGVILLVWWRLCCYIAISILKRRPFVLLFHGNFCHDCFTNTPNPSVTSIWRKSETKGEQSRGLRDLPNSCSHGKPCKVTNSVLRKGMFAFQGTWNIANAQELPQPSFALA